MRVERADAIDWLLRLHPGAAYVICNALARDVYETHDRPGNLYLAHGMGQALAIGVGLAQARPELEVVVIDGDGAALMGMASWALLPLPNLTYYVIKNDVYETTGGQPIGLTFTDTEDVLVVEVERGKIGRPKGAPIRDVETDQGYISPMRALNRFEAWLNEKSGYMDSGNRQQS